MSRAEQLKLPRGMGSEQRDERKQRPSRQIISARKNPEQRRPSRQIFPRGDIQSKKAESNSQQPNSNASAKIFAAMST